MKRTPSKKCLALALPRSYDSVLSGMVGLLAAARRASARTVNAIMTATYWEIGRRIVEFEQAGSPMGNGKMANGEMAEGRGKCRIVWVG